MLDEKVFIFSVEIFVVGVIIHNVTIIITTHPLVIDFFTFWLEESEVT